VTDPALTPLPTIDEPGDAELISAVRAGDLEAYGTLFERHVEAARRLARQLVSSGDVDDLVSDAFSKVLGVLQKGGGPDLAFRAYLLTSLRRLHVDKIRAGSRLTPTDDLTPYDPGVPFEDTAVAGFDNAAAAKAFAALPERWQQVLWHTEVEGQKPAEIAPLLGMSPNSVSALAYRAREGLRQAFISMHAQEALDDACARTRANLGAYIRGGLSKRDSAKVEAHLQDCRECTAIYLELTEVNSNLGALLAPLLLGTAGAGYLAAAAGGTKLGILVFFGSLKGWVLHNPVGRVVAGGTGVAAAAAVVAVAVAMTGGNPPPKPAAEPSASSAPPAAAPPAAPPAAPQSNPPKKSSPQAPPAATPSAPPSAPPATTPSAPPSSTPPTTPPEQAPVISTPLPAVSVTPGKSVVIDLTNGATDPNGDPLTVKSASVAKPSHGTVRKGGTKGRPVLPRLSGGKTGVSGSAFVLARSTGGATTVTYTPDAGWRGSDTIDYTLTDGHGGEVSGSVKVRTPNAAPVANADSGTVQANWVDGAQWTMAPAGGIDIPVVKNDTDPNPGDPQRLRVVQVAQGTRTSTTTLRLKYGTVTVRGRVLHYQPVPWAATTPVDGAVHDKFSYTVSDGYTGEDGSEQRRSAPVDVTIEPTSDASLSNAPLIPDPTDYEHFRLSADGIPDGAHATFSLTLTKFVGWKNSPEVTTSGGCGQPADADGTMTIRCSNVHNGEIVHIDAVVGDGWKLTSSLDAVGFSDPDVRNNTFEAADASDPSSVATQSGASGVATQSGASGRNSGSSEDSAATGNPSGSVDSSEQQRGAADPPASTETPTETSTRADDDHPSLISRVFHALF